ncbi:hypothetical protein Q4488_07380 [Amphritea sp. 1_MG-2023]|uniref:hypothetical protein n=1 Tax=Amphritea sp. 1_MG-2023 TaxID=3062670 RepID=UPI0026E475EC|nr:hypothetical protein [Amphritea sp. 1_MG-2023]MDO6563205.1 hypothetical protein [Amphritea sp. 1_MG-2023]
MLPLFKLPEQSALKDDELKDSVLLYLAGRIGDRVAYLGLDDLSGFNIEAASEPDTLLIKHYLDASDQNLLRHLLTDAEVHKKFNRLLTSLAI